MHTASHPVVALRSDVAYAALKERLLVGDFALNTRMVEGRLAELVGVSRTPVREALHRLHAEGLVRRANDGGFEPVAPDVAGVRHLYEVRIGLELLALRRPLASGRAHDPDALDALVEEWTSLRDDPDTGASAGFVLLDEAFHVGLAEAAGNPALADLLRQVNERIRVVRMQDFLSAERVARTIEEHLAVADSVRRHDLAEAERRFSDHVARSMAVVEERTERAIARMITGGRPG